MLVSSKHKFIFVHIYKNAGTSVTHALRPFALSEKQWLIYRFCKKLDLPLPFSDPHPFHGHITAQDIVDAMGVERFNSYFSFAIVRNPWDWQVSLYKYILKLESHRQHGFVEKFSSFDDYIVWKCEHDVELQKDFVCARTGEQIVNYIARFENIIADFREVCSALGIHATLPKLNATKESSYRLYYSDLTRKLVGKTYEADVDLFKYTFD